MTPPVLNVLKDRLANGMWNTFYCWLLYFSCYHEVRNNQGFSGLHNLSSAQQKHSKHQTHVHCYLQLKLFGKQQTVDLITVGSQTPLTVRQLHMNGNKEWPELSVFIILCWPKQVGVVGNSDTIYTRKCTVMTIVCNTPCPLLMLTLFCENYCLYLISHLSSSVVSHVLISGNRSVLSSKMVIS